MSKSQKKFALGALIAAVAGFLAGILSAPKSGKQTRADIKATAAKALIEGERQLKNLHSELGEMVESAEDKAKTLQGKAKTEMNKHLATAQTAKEKAKELLTALHEGDAEDKELQATIKQARSSLNHLKTFLKK